MKTMNEAIEARFGRLTATVCEYEVITNQQRVRIEELEAELAAAQASSQQLKSSKRVARS
ncbi:hypothetical protein C8J32_10455 [Rhizobium sp. PP-CC-3A-592]|nr:hypothetical protein C8J32_10455 [Rhizobium sp. PP-CC-3A-592]